MPQSLILNVFLQIYIYIGVCSYQNRELRAYLDHLFTSSVGTIYIRNCICRPNGSWSLAVEMINKNNISSITSLAIIHVK